MKFTIKISMIILGLFMSSSVFAWWNSFVEFTYTNGKFCEVANKNSCLQWVDRETFGKFYQAKSIFWEEGQYVYSDKNALYFFPVNDEWRRVEIDHKNLKKIWSDYYTDSKNIYYAQFPINGISKIWVGNKPYSFLGNTLIYDGIVYSRSTPLQWIVGKKLIRDTKKKFGSETPGYLIYGSTVFIDQGFSFIKLRWVDIPTFRKTDAWFEDKNKFFKKIEGHYGFDFEITKK